MASRLFERVRDELGLAYFVGALRLIGLNRGMFLFYAGTRSDALDAVYGEFASEIARFKNGGIEEKELREVRHRLLTARLFSEQRLGNRAMRAGLNCLYGLPVNDNAIYREKLEAATVGNLAEFAQDQFRDEQRVRLSVLPV
jgi:zinc protease